jgi:putative nucleotidyltransferase with HDIG domain
MIKKDEALSLLEEFTKSESLLKHARAVACCVRAYAEKAGENADEWEATALLHDFDYEKYPDEHPRKGAEILRERGYDEELIETILSHADFTGVPRTTPLRKTLYACDELAGFITAVTLVRPSKSIDDVKVKSVKKKLKDKAFARAVNREEIAKGAEELGVEPDAHIQFCIDALRNCEEEWL